MDAELEEDELALALPTERKRGRAGTYNEAALLLKLEQLTGGVDTDTDDTAWLETLTVTAPEPLGVEDAEDDLQRELAFYNQALSAVKSAQTRLTKLGVPYLRPDDYFAEMLKSDAHMSKVKARLIRQQEGIFHAEQRRKQQHNKKFGKQVRQRLRLHRSPGRSCPAPPAPSRVWRCPPSCRQVQREKLEAKAKQKTAESQAAATMRKQRKACQRRGKWPGTSPRTAPRERAWGAPRAQAANRLGPERRPSSLGARCGLSELATAGAQDVFPRGPMDIHMSSGQPERAGVRHRL